MTANTNQTAAAFGAGRFANGRRAGPDSILIRSLRARGIGIQNIAKMTGCSMEDVSRALGMGCEDEAPAPVETLEIEDYRAARDARFRQMWLSGASRNEMANVFGLDISSIDRKRGQMGLPKRGRTVTRNIQTGARK